MDDSNEKLIQKLERNIISYLTTGNQKAYEMVDSLKELICSRSVVEILKRKNGIATVIRVDGFQYTLQHPNQKKRGVAKV